RVVDDHDVENAGNDGKDPAEVPALVAFALQLVEGLARVVLQSNVRLERLPGLDGIAAALFPLLFSLRGVVRIVGGVGAGAALVGVALVGAEQRARLGVGVVG